MADRVKLDNPVRLGLAPDNLFRLGKEVDETVQFRYNAFTKHGGDTRCVSSFFIL